MFYRISGKDTIKIDLLSSFVVTLSGDGSEAIISSEQTPNGFDILEAYSNRTDVDTLIQTDFWKQPCINCQPFQNK
jgi:hypothetical protein